MAVTNKQVLEAIQALREDELAEIKQKLDQLNGRQRESEQVQASLVQWRRDHEAVADEMKDEIKAQRNKTNIAATVLALGQVISAVIFGNKP